MLSPVSPSEPDSSSHDEGPCGVVVLKLELSVSTTNALQTPMCSHVLLTQEELPAEPGSGSEGSSAVESMSIASMHSSTGFLCTSLMPGINNVLGRTLKVGRRPSHHDCTRPLQRPWNELLRRQPQDDKPPATKVRTQHPRIRCHWRPPSAARPRRPHGGIWCGQQQAI